VRRPNVPNLTELQAPHFALNMPDRRPVTQNADQEPDLTGRRLGDYQLLRRLGRGAMAEVYLAEQQSLHRPVAFKVLKESLALDKNYVRRFHNEAKAAAALVHAGIVQIHEVGCVDGIHFIAQEYVQGQNLKQFLARRPSVEVPLAVSIMRQVSAALYKAGEQGIVHRDIKPDNIMISTDGAVKVADFGLARIAGDGDAVGLTQVGMTMGTPLYMSPEQAEGKSLDPRSDIYSFGVTCYQMLAGHPPFTGETPLSVAVQHIKQDPEPLENVRKDLPGGICRIVHRMLAKDPDGRYQNAVELLKDLRGIQVDGLDDDWSTGAEDWTTAEVTASANARVEATRRLDNVMQTAAVASARHRDRRREWITLAVALVFAFFIGAMIARSTRGPDLLQLNHAERVELVQRKESPNAQFFYAMQLNTERAWQSVWEYFPEGGGEQNTYYVRRAKQNLARFYLEPDHFDPDRALRIFDELARLDRTEQQFRAFGLAGQAIVFNLKGEYKKSADKASSALTFRDHLGPAMRTELERIARANRLALQQQD